MDRNPSNEPAFPTSANGMPTGLTKLEWMMGQVAPAVYAALGCKHPAETLAVQAMRYSKFLLGEHPEADILKGARVKPEHVETVAETVAHALLLGVATKRGVNGSSDKFNLHFGEGQEVGIWFSKNAPGGVSCGADDIIALRAAIASRRPSV